MFLGSKEQIKDADTEQSRATPVPAADSQEPVQPVGLDAVGSHINKALHSIVSTLMSNVEKFSAFEDNETDSKDPQQNSSSALRSAITTNDVGVMELLLDHGASLSAYDKDGDVPIHFAVRKKKLEPLKGKNQMNVHQINEFFDNILEKIEKNSDKCAT